MLRQLFGVSSVEITSNVAVRKSENSELGHVVRRNGRNVELGSGMSGADLAFRQVWGGFNVVSTQTFPKIYSINTFCLLPRVVHLWRENTVEEL